jgi:hypothetical protein
MKGASAEAPDCQDPLIRPPHRQSAIRAISGCPEIRFLADVECHLIGDCMAPRNLMVAIHEGHAIGNAL